jgi:hypothetical protein
MREIVKEELQKLVERKFYLSYIGQSMGFTPCHCSEEKWEMVNLHRLQRVE